MKKYFLHILAFLLGTSGFYGFYNQHTPPEKTLEAFDIATLEKQRVASGRAYLPFLNRETLMAGLYVLSAGAPDPQPVHELDEVYYILDGKSQFLAGKDTVQVQEGSVLFVAAHETHRFFNIEQELKVLVFFSTKQP
ncbi:MAG: cupin domain-containing protein [Saprospiraceae bacterium]|nr:cupin domain-containing protein [Saprospiraceae bacterium]